MDTQKPTIRRRPRKSAQIGAGMRLGGYVRVSMHGERDTEHESYITERDQREKIEAWAAEKGVEIAEWYVDSNVSGKTMRRPDLDRMLADVRAGTIDGAAVAYLDRFSRAKVGDAMEIVKEMSDAHKPLAILDVPGATRRPRAARWFSASC